MTGDGLAGARVLVTRPRRQAGELVAAVEGAGGVAVCFPVLEIEGRDPGTLEREHASLPVPDIAIFVSANAVEHALHLFGPEVRIAAVGPATRRAIESAGRAVQIWPEQGFDSEHLLREPALNDVAGQTLRIIRADTGRELLADTLRRRGARVDYLSAYRRLPRRVPDAELEELESLWRTDRIGFVIVMSVATLDALLSILPAYCRNALPDALLVTPSSRVIQTAGERAPAVRAILAPGPQAGDTVRAMEAALDGKQ